MIDWTVLVQAGVPFAGGLFGTALGFGLIRLPGTSDLINQKFFSHLKWLGPLVAVFGVYLGWQSYRPAPSAEATARVLASRVSLPIRTDSITTLEAIEGSGQTITFRSALAAIPRSFEERVRLENAFRKQSSNFACNDAEMLSLLDAGYTLAWSYRLNDGTEIRVAIARELCGHRTAQQAAAGDARNART